MESSLEPVQLIYFLPDCNFGRLRLSRYIFSLARPLRSAPLLGPPDLPGGPWALEVPLFSSTPLVINWNACRGQGWRRTLNVLDFGARVWSRRTVANSMEKL